MKTLDVNLREKEFARIADELDDESQRQERYNLILNYFVKYPGRLNSQNENYLAKVVLASREFDTKITLLTKALKQNASQTRTDK